MVLFAVLFLMPELWAEQKPKNIILMIGDGMGVGHITLARLAVQAEGKSLVMDSMKIGGIVQTRAANSVVTDSAAAGTALATGWKTNVGMISVLPDNTPAISLLEIAQEMGKTTGLVTTTTITDATPAVFASHIESRSDQAAIAKQMLDHNVNVLLGGGREYFIPQTQAGSKRKDSVDLLAQAKQAGYAMAGSNAELVQAKSGKILGLFALDNLTTEAPEPTLAELTDKALGMISNNKRGFFLMVEGGEIDRRAHAGDAAGVIKQVRDFDAAVAVVLTFARKNNDTLVVMTADHETGGLIVLAPPRDSKDQWSVAWASRDHSASNVMLLAEGVGAGSFGGVMDNTDVPKVMAKLWNVKDFPRKMRAQEKAAGMPNP
jgi:alkaline phosphatase